MLFQPSKRRSGRTPAEPCLPFECFQCTAKHSCWEILPYSDKYFLLTSGNAAKTRNTGQALVIGGGSIPVIAGLAVGLGGAIGLARFIESMLFATSAIDVPVLAGVSVLFMAVALGACFVPAWRAASVDPMTALRKE